NSEGARGASPAPACSTATRAEASSAAGGGSVAQAVAARADTRTSRFIPTTERHISYPELPLLEKWRRGSVDPASFCAGPQFRAANDVKWRWALAAMVVGLLMLVQAAAVQVPSGLRVGAELLPARSCATRDTLWIHHYAAALYLPPRSAPAAALEDPQQPKALHVQILSKSFLPRDLPKKWHQTLESEL